MTRRPAIRSIPFMTQAAKPAATPQIQRPVVRSTAQLLLGVFSGLMMLGGVHAADATPLRLEDALRAAVDQHPSVAARRSDRKAAEMKLEVAERQRLPGLVAQSGSDANGARNTTVRVSQPLWTGGRITGEIDLAQAAISQAQATIVQAQQDIMVRVATAFTELGRVQARQLAARSNVLEHERLASMIQRRVDSQISPVSDSVQASARLSQARAELNLLEAQALKARSALAQATGQPVSDIALPAQRSMDDQTLAGLTASALAYSPVLRRLEHEYQGASADMAVRRSAAFPQVQMRLDHNRTRVGSNTQIYLAIDAQTGAGFSVMASVREAEAKREAIESQIQASRRDTIDAIAADWADLRSQNEQSLNLTSQVQSTTSVFDSFVRQYAVGRKGWNDVLNAQREVAQARFQLADSDWGALRSALRLQIATGMLSAEQIVLAPAPEATPTATTSHPVPPVAAANPQPLASPASEAPATAEASPKAEAPAEAPAAAAAEASPVAETVVVVEAPVTAKASPNAEAQAETPAAANTSPAAETVAAAEAPVSAEAPAAADASPAAQAPLDAKAPAMPETPPTADTSAAAAGDAAPHTPEVAPATVEQTAQPSETATAMTQAPPQQQPGESAVANLAPPKASWSNPRELPAAH
ncbi:TolC family protein [Hydrogenophaga sp.]|uniref:TolC family protein n=1 Tax=Hydrogenophaga sp. TaxID=1904254 RepID=UPI003F6AAABE